MLGIDSRPAVRFIRNLLPSSKRSKFDFWYKHVFYSRYYKVKFLGFFKFLRYSLLPKIKEGGKIILGIEGFQKNAPAIGNFLDFQMRLLCLAESEKAEKIDIALVYDFANPIWDKDVRMSSWLNASNFHYHLADIYPLLNINPKMGSLFVFNSQGRFDQFINQNKKRYHLCPTLFNFVNGESAARGCLAAVNEFYSDKKYLPKFTFRPAVSLWAKSFIKKYAGSRYPVTVNFRVNKLFGTGRNSDIESWKNLFENCLKKHSDVVFFIISRKNEILPELKKLPNVVFIGEFDLTVEYKLALIRHSLFHLGVNSGTASFLWTSDVPFCIYRFYLLDQGYNYNWVKQTETPFPWLNKETQKLVWAEETPESLIRDFEHLFEKVDKDKWSKDREVPDSYDFESVLKWPHFIPDEYINPAPQNT